MRKYILRMDTDMFEIESNIFNIDRTSYKKDIEILSEDKELVAKFSVSSGLSNKYKSVEELVKSGLIVCGYITNLEIYNKEIVNSFYNIVKSIVNNLVSTSVLMDSNGLVIIESNNKLDVLFKDSDIKDVCMVDNLIVIGVKKDGNNN